MIKRILWISVVLFAVPVLGHVVADALRTFTEARFADEFAQLTGPLSIATGLSCPQQPLGLEILAPCITLGHVDLLAAFSDRVIGIIIFILAVIFGAAAVAYGSRRRLAALFFPITLFVVVMVAGLIVLQSVILIGTLYTAVYTLTRGAIIGGMVIGAVIGQTIAIYFMLVAVFEALRPEPLEIVGKDVSREEQPRLWQFIDDIARKLDTRPPNSIVCGLPTVFFVVPGDVRIRGQRGRLLPNTLYLSLPMMRVMSRSELACVLGHELGHLIGEDQAYTSNFVHPYSASVRSLDAIGDHGPLVALPAFTVLAFLLGAFGIARLAVLRKRELEADQFGVRASDVQAHVTALLRTAALSPLWYYLVAEVTKRGGVQNASAAFDAAAVDFVKSVDRKDLLSKIASTRVAHPVDSHPTIVERLKAQGQSLNEAEHLLDFPQDRSVALLDDFEALEESLTYELGLAPRGNQQPPGW